jgi:hypothetical protein|tara:strand:- start:3045 stop:3212 length:168 start_codon:yes stop_codon:yes gene_type:complete
MLFTKRKETIDNAHVDAHVHFALKNPAGDICRPNPTSNAENDAHPTDFAALWLSL